MYTSEDECLHGVTWDEPCVECEEIGLKGTVGWMKPIVMEAEKRLKEIKNGRENRHAALLNNFGDEHE